MPVRSPLQLLLQFLALPGLGIVLRGVMPKRVASALLRLRHGGTGVCEQGVDGLAIPGEHRYADTGCYGDFVPTDVKRFFQHEQYSARQQIGDFHVG